MIQITPEQELRIIIGTKELIVFLMAFGYEFKYNPEEASLILRLAARVIELSSAETKDNRVENIELLKQELQFLLANG
jgi:hypothetical protein